MRDWLWWKHVAASSKPILIGPWRSELGFEASYWLPWLTRWRQEFKIAKERLIAISRGGAAAWYDAAHQVELYDYAPVDRIRKAMLADAAQHQSVKQHRITDWEAKILPVIAHDLGLRRYHLLHPSRMYQALTPWWNGKMGQFDALKQLTFAPIPVPPPPLTLPLPERFVAVKFYARHTWPLSEEHTTWVANLMDYLVKHIPVVVLNTGLAADDHRDFPIEPHPNVLTIQDHVTLQNNLAVQSAIIQKSVGFVGTYGGAMQLAVRLHKPSVGIYSKFAGTAYAHKTLTEWLAMQQETPCFIGRPKDGQWVREVLGV